MSEVVDQRLQRLAGAVTVLLTVASFGLSYTHLAHVAHTYGMGTVAGWVWPATIDSFIVIGELLVLRASLKGGRDWFAYLLVVAGSLGSIALNVAGVGSHMPTMNYVVAAVPPVAALLAFAALMRGVHARLVDSDVSTSDTDADTVDSEVSAPSVPLSLVASASGNEVSATDTTRTQVTGGGHPRADSIADRVDSRVDKVDNKVSPLLSADTDADTIIREGWTRGHSVRATADTAGVSKSTVHKRYKQLDLTRR